MATQILSSDIEIRAAERMTDSSDGGGRMSGVTIIDNKINLLLSPVSEADRVAGRVSLREAYLHINTANAATYRGTNAVLDKAPTDPNVNVLLFDIGKEAGSRDEAKQYVESYISTGPRARFHPLGTQNAGQSQILCYQKTSAPLPEIGDVYVIQNESTEVNQAFRIQALESYNETYAYTDGGGIKEFSATTLLITMTQALAYSFTGSDPTPLYPGASWIRMSLASDSASYRGITPLKENITSGDLQIVVSETQQQLIPITQSEIQKVDEPIVRSTTTINAGSHDVEVSNYAHSSSYLITIANRGSNYSAILRPIPSLDSLIVSYRAQGRWYTLQSDINGDITGAATEYGSGKLLITGSATVTLGIEPDIDSSIIWQWGSNVHYSQRLDPSFLDPPSMDIDFGEPIFPTTLVINYVTASIARQATTTIEGVITGYGIAGQLDSANGTAKLTWTILPDANINLVCDYQTAVKVTEVLTNVAWKDVLTTLSPNPQLTAPIQPGTLKLEWYPTGYINYNPQTEYDDGVGGLRVDTVGTINYTTGEIVINPTRTVYEQRYNSPPKAYPPNVAATEGTWSTISTDCGINDGIINASFMSASGTARTGVVVTLPPVQFFVGSLLYQDTIVPGSLRFQWGTTYEYRDVLGNGTLYKHAVPWTTQQGTYSGTINYASRLVTLSDYEPLPVENIIINSCLTQYGAWPTHYSFGRTPGSPLRPGSFQVRVTTVDGSELIGVADQSGDINAAFIQGTINQEMGVFDLKFGELVLESNLTADQRLEWWYDADNIIDYGLTADQKIDWWYSRWPSGKAGYIWIPKLVWNSTLFMNEVITVTLSLSAEELGLDPVRLPASGKVPIFKPGYRIVVHDTQELELPNPATAGSVHDCGRTRLARAILIDASGRRIPDDRIYPGQYVLYSGLTPEQKALYQWTDIREDGTVWFPSNTDLDAGTIELASPLDLTGYDQPISIHHTIEDAALATSVDLSGLIGVNIPLSHNYSAATAKVSSQLYYGDMYARYTNLLSQVSWTNVWSDSIIGSNTSAQYNDTLYPIVVTNDGIIHERWRLTFTSTTAFDVYGEDSGKIATGTIYTDCEPSNPVAAGAYFKIDYRGWGTGWAIGNTVRFNTVWPGAFWVARCVSPGVATGTADTVGLTFRGDSDPA